MERAQANVKNTNRAIGPSQVTRRGLVASKDRDLLVCEINYEELVQTDLPYLVGSVQQVTHTSLHDETNCEILQFICIIYSSVLHNHGTI